MIVYQLTTRVLHPFTTALTLQYVRGKDIAATTTKGQLLRVAAAVEVDLAFERPYCTAHVG